MKIANKTRKIYLACREGKIEIEIPENLNHKWCWVKKMGGQRGVSRKVASNLEIVSGRSQKWSRN